MSGRVVDDDVHAGRGLEGPDVPALAPDDAALHLVAGEGDGGHRGLGGGLRREPLGGDGDDAAGVAVRVLLGLLLDVAHQRRGLTPGLVLHPLEDLAARVLGGESRDPLQAEALLLRHLVGLALAGPQRQLLLRDHLLALVDPPRAAAHLLGLPVLLAGALVGPALDPLPLLTLALVLPVELLARP